MRSALSTFLQRQFLLKFFAFKGLNRENAFFIVLAANLHFFSGRKQRALPWGLVFIFGRTGASLVSPHEAFRHGEGVILSLIELMPIPGKRQEIVELLRFSAERLRTRPGCLRSGVYETSDEDDNKTILYLEQWRSEEDLHRHIKSNLYLGVLNAIDLATGPPLISFHEVSNTKSMDLIVALRTSGVA